MNAARRDLADIALAGRWFAPHYAVPETMAGTSGVDIVESPGGKRISQLLPSETFSVVETSGGWAWGYGDHDRYVGYVRADALVSATGRAAPDLPPAGADVVTIAEHFLDMPYLWGGRGIGGIDCSGLAQIAYGRAGIQLPRDSDQQAALGTADVPAELRRGDLVFFPDHVVMMTGPADAIHASGHHMKVVTETLASIVARQGPPTGHYRP